MAVFEQLNASVLSTRVTASLIVRGRARRSPDSLFFFANQNFVGRRASMLVGSIPADLELQPRSGIATGSLQLENRN
jgi:hypothetical protein